ncbi:hypothetical protein NP233_g12933 [Leucocoprinus birnbaumii]|uniref:Uncharacterized protein n=1 Tax=Leucocoprinus birnbaumii TaxID=56174 RepID=A0AAD5VJ85_9AGAR|nr:hypothetical protein NP233_g12933 [Leucocoprinus birnbaumii]
MADWNDAFSGPNPSCQWERVDPCPQVPSQSTVSLDVMDVGMPEYHCSTIAQSQHHHHEAGASWPPHLSVGYPVHYSSFEETQDVQTGSAFAADRDRPITISSYTTLGNAFP